MENETPKNINLILIREDLRNRIVDSCDFDTYKDRVKKEKLDSDLKSFLSYVSYDEGTNKINACIKLENWCFDYWQTGGFYKYEIKNEKLKNQILSSI